LTRKPLLFHRCPQQVVNLLKRSRIAISCIAEEFFRLTIPEVN